MKILITGVNGQVGHALARQLTGAGDIVAVDRSRMDLSNISQIRDVIRAVRPELIINPAAYTAVDRAETDAAAAMRINGDAPAVMAEEAKRIGAAMIQYSTDYVFDGSKEGKYLETDLTGPLNVYGKSKLAGEQAVQAAGIPHLILRTSWVYGMRGSNFLLTMLRLAREREQLRIVGDQVGSPTWSGTVADVTAQLLRTAGKTAGREWWNGASGLYHLSARGSTSWHGFADAILRQAGLEKMPELVPIATSEYPTPARRPVNSVMSCEHLESVFGVALPEWPAALAQCMQRANPEAVPADAGAGRQ